MVLPQNELSDHNKIVTELNHIIPPTIQIEDDYDWIPIENNYIWDDKKSEEFRNCLDLSHEVIGEIRQRLDAGLIDSSGKLLQELFIVAAANTLEKKKSSKKNTNNATKKWFDRDCNKLKKETRKLGREKNNDPSNIFLREKYNEKLKQYKSNCKSKRHAYWQNVFVEIGKALQDPKIFWKTWKNSAEKHELFKTPDISGDRWFNHFSKLHTKSFENTLPPFVPNQPDPLLNLPFTKNNYHLLSMT